MRTIRGTKANDTLTAPYVLVGNPLLPPDGYEMFGEDGDDTVTGSNVADILHGGRGRDTLNGGSGNDTLEGGADADVLDGGTGIDTASYEFSDKGVTVSLRAGRGSGGHAEGDTLRNIENLLGSRYADNLSGDKGANVLMGGDGNDRLFGDDGNDTLEGGAGKDSLDGGNGIDTARYTDSGAGVTVNLATGTGQGGTAQGDTLTNIENVTGSAYDDVLIGDAGNNVLNGGAGNDLLEGSAGDDTLNGGAGADTITYANAIVGTHIHLGAGYAHVEDAATVYERDDVSSIENVVGSAFNDEITGSAEANVLEGGAGDDVIEGEDGDDTLRGGDGADLLDGGDDNDVIEGGDGNDDIRGRDGNDTLFGGDGNDTLVGGYDHDLLEGGAGHDEIFGSDGQDTVSYESSNAGVFVVLNLGFQYYPNLPDDPNLPGVGAGGHASGDTLYSVENIVGSSYGDVLWASPGDNVVHGGDGDDVIVGAGGLDEIWGDAGNDTFAFIRPYGGSLDEGNLTIIHDFAAGSDEDIIDLVDAGTGYHSFDDVLAHVQDDYFAPSGVNGVLIDLGPSGGVLLAGLSSGDLEANDFMFGHDTLVGSSVDDVFEGGAGHEEIFGGDGQDTVSYASSNAGVVLLLDSTPNSSRDGSGGHAEGDTLYSIENVVGSSYGDVLGGSSGDNVIHGGGGDDTIVGEGGLDEIWGDAGNDTFVFVEHNGGSLAEGNLTIIHDFTAGGDQDVIDLVNADTGYYSLDDVLAHAQYEYVDPSGVNGVLIDLGPSGGVLLAGLSTGDLDANDFMFA